MSFTDAHIIGRDVPNAEYRKQAFERGHPKHVMSRGSLMDFMACPSRWRKGYETPDTKATEWGTLIDTMALTPHLAVDRIAVAPATYPAEKGESKPWNWNANHCKEWRKQQGGKLVFKNETAQDAKAAIEILIGDPIIREFLECSERQVMVMADYQDDETGIVVPVKILIDLVPTHEHIPFGKSLADLKTSFTADPYVWEKKVFDDDLDTQGALYLDVYTAATNEDRVDFRHIIQESEPPFQVGRRWLTSEYIEIGRMKYLAALKRYARCLKENVWPDYDSEARPGRTLINGWNETRPADWMMMRVAETAFHDPTQQLPKAFRDKPLTLTP